jgi:hypothetical protein
VAAKHRLIPGHGLLQVLQRKLDLQVTHRAVQRETDTGVVLSSRLLIRYVQLASNQLDAVGVMASAAGAW